MKNLTISLSVACLALVACGGRQDLYEIKFSDAAKAIDRSDMSRAQLPSFMLVSDTQFAVPYTDYELSYQLGQQTIRLPPALSTLESKSFYRNAAAHLLVPLAFESIIDRELAKKREFGLFGGDMAEFSCKAEAKHVFDMLKRKSALPFIITIGNHDAAFHGSFDTDAVSRGGKGEWDSYSYDLWGGVCAMNGGRLTKSGFIEQVLDYYKTAWGLDVTKAKELQSNPDFASKALPRGKAYSGSVEGHPRADGTPEWRLEFEFQLSFEEGPQSHRQSHLYQRFVQLDPKHREKLAFTSLDTTDYGTRPALCDSSGTWVDAVSRFVQIGLGGAISNEQVRWLEQRPLSGARLPHFVLSHYLPFQDVVGLSGCDSTYGAHCLGRRLVEALHGGTFIYGHVHQPFKEGLIKRIDCTQQACNNGKGGCVLKPIDQEACENLAQNALVRLPSLIDNKSYVVFDGHSFGKEDLAKTEGLVASAPFANADYDTCQQRAYEAVELQLLTACVAAVPVGNKVNECPKADDVKQDAKRLAGKVCDDYSSAWVSENAQLFQRFQTPVAGSSIDGVCAGWSEGARWRCILRGLSYSWLTETFSKPPYQGDESRQLDLAERLLNAVEPLRKDKDEEHR